MQTEFTTGSTTGQPNNHYSESETMEQKTESSQAVDERQTMMEVLGMCIDALDRDADRAQRETAAAKAIHVLGRAALKAQPAPTEAQGGKLLELLKLTLGTLGLHDIAEARRIGALCRADFNSPEIEGIAQPSGNTGELVQGEPYAWSYECRQPFTDPVIWAEFIGRDKPTKNDPKWTRNVKPLFEHPASLLVQGEDSARPTVLFYNRSIAVAHAEIGDLRKKLHETENKNLQCFFGSVDIYGNWNHNPRLSMTREEQALHNSKLEKR